MPPGMLSVDQACTVHRGVIEQVHIHSYPFNILTQITFKTIIAYHKVKNAFTHMFFYRFDMIETIEVVCLKGFQDR